MQRKCLLSTAKQYFLIFLIDHKSVGFLFLILTRQERSWAIWRTLEAKVLRGDQKLARTYNQNASWKEKGGAVDVKYPLCLLQTRLFLAKCHRISAWMLFGVQELSWVGLNPESTELCGTWLSEVTKFGVACSRGLIIYSLEIWPSLMT